MSTPVIGREGLLRLVKWAEGLRARAMEGGGAPGMVRSRASSPDGGADECSGRELWASFPEAARNDILRLLGILLERRAVSAGLAAERAGGEHDAAG